MNDNNMNNNNMNNNNMNNNNMNNNETSEEPSMEAFGKMTKERAASVADQYFLLEAYEDEEVAEMTKAELLDAIETSKVIDEGVFF